MLSSFQNLLGIIKKIISNSWRRGWLVLKIIQGSISKLLLVYIRPEGVAFVIIRTKTRTSWVSELLC